jgi:glutaredoxin-like protein NrdH
VKEFLSRAEVPFVVRDVDEDDGAYEELVSRGWRAVPVTIIGDRAIRGFDPVALRDALQAGRENGKEES